jgi:hypothetical protein
MLTIPTSELIGLITDVIGFAPSAKDDPSNGILIEWDGHELSAAGYDVLSGGVSTWTPGEGQEGSLDDSEGAHDATDIDWGGDDSPWKVFISGADAREIVKTFKLPAKLWRVPLLVKCSPTGSSLFVERTKETGRTAHLAMFRSDTDLAAKFPDIRAIAASARRFTRPADNEVFAAQRLATFGAVRPHGLMDITFGAENIPSAVNIGVRFVGFIYAATDGKAASARHHSGSSDLNYSDPTPTE